MNKVEQRYKNDIEAFGEKFKELRKARNLTQLDIEVATGIDRTQISRIENGLNNIEFFTIVKLAIALDINTKEFFGDQL